MNNVRLYLSVLFTASLLSLSVHLKAQIGNHQIVQQRTTGVAPLGVHFSIKNLPWADLMNEDYCWQFQDSIIGYQVANTFQTSGTYKLEANQTSNPFGHNINIVVLDPDDVYSGANTVCVSASGSFSGCPTGALQFTLDNLDTVSFLDNKRILLNRDDTFELNVPKTLGTNSYFSNYGSGTAKPVVTINGDPTTTSFWVGDTVVVTGISFVGSEWVIAPAWGENLYGEGRLFAPQNFNTFHDLEVYNMTSFVIMDDGIGAKNNIIIDGVNAENLGSYFLYAGPNPSIMHSAVINCSIKNVMANHAIRLNGGQYFLVHNTSIQDVERAQITFRGLEYGLVNDSRFSGKSLYKNSIRNISNDAATNDSVSNICFERNQYLSNPNEFAFDFNIGKNIDVRNNIILNSSINVGINLANISPQNVKIYNNTMYQNNYDWFSMVNLNNNSSGSFYANIVWADSCGSSCFAENPFASYSSEDSTKWKFYANNYYKTGSTSTEFKSTLSFIDWVNNVNDYESSFSSITFKNLELTIGPKNDNFNLEGSTLSTKVYAKRDFLGYLRNYQGEMNSYGVPGAIERNRYVSIGEKNISNFNLKVFPNPVFSTLNIYSDKVDMATLIVYNLLGRQMINMDYIPKQIDVSSYPNGVYFLSIKQENGTAEIIKFIKL